MGGEMKMASLKVEEQLDLINKIVADLKKLKKEIVVQYKDKMAKT